MKRHVHVTSPNPIELRRLAGALALVVVLAWPGASARAAAARRAPSPVLHGSAARAVVAYEAMQRYFYIPGTGLYRGGAALAGGETSYSFLWPFSQAFAATVSLGYIPGQRARFLPDLRVRLHGLQDYWDAPSQAAAASGETLTSTLPSYNGVVATAAESGGASYYDDNEWVGIELVRAYELDREASALANAEQIMAFVMDAWQTDPQLACPGGIPFSNAAANTDRNTVTDAPAAELGVQLYRVTHNVGYLQFAEMAYEWVRRCLLAPNNMYADHIGPHGTVEPKEWSYNQGSMIGAGTLLFQATGNSAYLYQARQTAAAALPYYGSEQLRVENPFFAAVYFRNLLYLDSVTHDPPGPRIAQIYVNDAWENLRLEDNLFVWGSPPSTELLGQAVIAQIYGLLATPPSTYF